MLLVPKYISTKLPVLYSQENEKDPMVICKFFTPWSNWTWYAIEFDGNDLFFGYVVGHDQELGYFSLSELQSIKGPFGLSIERDLYFEHQPLSKIKALHSRFLHGITISKPLIEPDKQISCIRLSDMQYAPALY